MNARTLIELKKALNYTAIGICIGIFITLSIHFCVSKVMEKMRRADIEKEKNSFYEQLMRSIPNELTHN